MFYMWLGKCLTHGEPLAVALEELHGPLMPYRLLAGRERAEVSVFARLGIDLA